MNQSPGMNPNPNINLNIPGPGNEFVCSAFRKEVAADLRMKAAIAGATHAPPPLTPVPNQVYQPLDFTFGGFLRACQYRIQSFPPTAEYRSAKWKAYGSEYTFTHHLNHNIFPPRAPHSRCPRNPHWLRRGRCAGLRGPGGGAGQPGHRAARTRAYSDGRRAQLLRPRRRRSARRLGRAECGRRVYGTHAGACLLTGEEQYGGGA
ncbi:hypothetical protein C8F04DRAFT_1151549 [Mycena alexandri]|uniref:Uncharacterized protein n=1 Tax=Mycena alexandri TaxID=1745969 RepID=A0AAD6WLE5_9AGAR|nr:hypothetical protein C8F04DRAFT_1151549 [Mycena alexandri]